MREGRSRLGSEERGALLGGADLAELLGSRAEWVGLLPLGIRVSRKKIASIAIYARSC